MRNSEVPVKARVGNYNVLTSGLIHTNESAISFDIADIEVIFTFSTDDGPSRFKGSSNEKTLTIELYNFNSVHGDGKLDPVEIGTVTGKALYATWSVDTFDTNLRRFGYTFYLKSK